MKTGPQPSEWENIPYHHDGATEHLTLKPHTYTTYHTPAIIAYTATGEVYDVLTVNLDDIPRGYVGIRDDYPQYVKLLTDAHIIENQDNPISIPSGFITIHCYPLTMAARNKWGTSVDLGEQNPMTLDDKPQF